MAPFPKWLYDVAIEIEHGIRGNNPAHIELARLLPSGLRVAAQVMADYAEVSQAQPAPAPEADTAATPAVAPLWVSLPSTVTPVTNPSDTGTHMIPANGAGS